MNKTTYILVLLALLGVRTLCAVGAPKQNGHEDRTGEPVRSEQEEDYENCRDLMVDFLDISKKKNTQISYWTKQLVKLIKQKDQEQIKRLKPFLQEFTQARRTRNALALGLAFRNHRERFNEPELATYIEKKIKRDGLQSILTALKHRLNK